MNLRKDIDWRGGYEKEDGTHVPARSIRKGWVASATTLEQIDEAQRKVEASLTPGT